MTLINVITNWYIVLNTPIDKSKFISYLRDYTITVTLHQLKWVPIRPFWWVYSYKEMENQNVIFTSQNDFITFWTRT